MNDPLDLIEANTLKKLDIDPDIVKTVIDFKWKSLAAAFWLNNTVEDSGLGTWSASKHRILKRIAVLEQSMQRKMDLTNFLRKLEYDRFVEELENLKNRI